MTEKLIIKSDFDRFDTWIEAFAEFDIEIVNWSSNVNLEDIKYALVWMPEANALKQFPQLEIVFSVGAGVDHLTGENVVPEHIPVVRMVEPALTAGMVEYVLYYVLHYHRFFAQYRQQQQQQDWQPMLQIPASDRAVGILGMGELGGAIAKQLLSLGFRVCSWSRSEKNIPQIESFVGNDQLPSLLRKSDILVSLLPNTPDTTGILNIDNLNLLPRGSYLINAGRGSCQIDNDILQAVQSGQLSGAALDVFQQEPLPSTHPLWQQPNIEITPHVASMTLPETSAKYVYSVIEKHRQNQPLPNVADLRRGY